MSQRLYHCPLTLLTTSGWFPGRWSWTPASFHTVHGVLMARIVKWLAIPFSSGPHPVRTLHHGLPSWVALHSMAHSFIELEKAVVHAIRLVSFLWLWFQSVWPLMPYLSAYCLTRVSLTLDMEYLLLATRSSSAAWPPLNTLITGITFHWSSDLQPCPAH